jgi:hypothetical protein
LDSNSVLKQPVAQEFKNREKAQKLPHTQYIRKIKWNRCEVYSIPKLKFVAVKNVRRMTAITDKCVNLIDAEEQLNTFANFWNMGDLKNKCVFMRT